MIDVVMSSVIAFVKAVVVELIRLVIDFLTWLVGG